MSAVIKKGKLSIAIIGAGPAALMLAANLDIQKYSVTVYEKNAAPGRKFLVAGDGGLNITHSESSDAFIRRYTPQHFIEKAFSHFNNNDLVLWLKQSGIPVFTGSSGRVFPEKHIKPIDALNILLEKVRSNGVHFCFRHHWKGWSDNGSLMMMNESRELELKSDVVVFALGGASWPVTGSAGDWRKYFEEKDVGTKNFEASNCAVRIRWPDDIRQKFAGAPLKNVMITCAGVSQTGEVVITEQSMEGSGIYPLSPEIRRELHEHGFATLRVDLKPVFTAREIKDKLRYATKQRTQNDKLKVALRLSRLQIALLRSVLSKADFMDAEALTGAIKSLPLRIEALAPVEDAISTVGGIPLSEIDEHFMLRKLPQHYVIGEMLDYDAPTGGYLLQSCFTMGKYLSHILNSTL